LSWSNIAWRGNKLALLGLIESGVPFLRMLALSRGLSLLELGYASALTSTDGLFGQITDFALHRFVLTAPREDFVEALSAAHALSVLRGLVVGGLAVCASPLIAAVFDLRADWGTFAALGLVAFLRSLEHLEPKVAERDYEYGVQLKASLAANGAGLAAMGFCLLVTRDHKAVLAFFVAQSIGQAIASRFVATTRYRLKFRSPYFVKAFRFGFPLMLNGMGLAAVSQGDRFLVGALLGLPSLGLYSVATLVTYVPTAILVRVAGTFTLSALFNAARERNEIYVARIRLVAFFAPLAAAAFALGIVTLMNIVTPLVFGRQFILSIFSVIMLSASTFIRIARIEPFTSILLQEGRTKRLAVGNLSAVSGLGFEWVLIVLYGNMEAALAGRVLGDLVSAIVVFWLTRQVARAAWLDYAKSASFAASVMAFSAAIMAIANPASGLGTSAIVLSALLMLITAWTAKFSPSLLRAAAFDRLAPTSSPIPGGPTVRPLKD
jgi:O-antigen/teichoic acid export membrane protein